MSGFNWFDNSSDSSDSEFLRHNEPASPEELRIIGKALELLAFCEEQGVSLPCEETPEKRKKEAAVYKEMIHALNLLADEMEGK